MFGQEEAADITINRMLRDNDFQLRGASSLLHDVVVAFAAVLIFDLAYHFLTQLFSSISLPTDFFFASPP